MVLTGSISSQITKSLIEKQTIVAPATVGLVAVPDKTLHGQEAGQPLPVPLVHGDVVTSSPPTTTNSLTHSNGNTNTP